MKLLIEHAALKAQNSLIKQQMQQVIEATQMAEKYQIDKQKTQEGISCLKELQGQLMEIGVSLDKALKE